MTDLRDEYLFRELERKVELLENEVRQLRSQVNGLKENHGMSSI
tara:strand:- start:233 stop:364 length:132 start_codon:yes stop_codon:yes gene_type:complete